MLKRQWKQWPSLTKKALNDTGSFTGLAGIGLGIAGVSLATPILLIIGGCTIGGTLLYAGYRGIPPKMLSASNIDGQISLSELETISPPILKIAIVGYTQAGKTTFLQNALQRPPHTNRTSYTSATILSLQTTPITYVALLDGDGEQLHQQFEIAKFADFLLVIVDHNLSDTKVAKSKKREEEHDNFLQQLLFKLQSNDKINKVHLILNKRDLWQKSKSSTDLEAWFNSHVDQWQSANIAIEVTSDIHSNNESSDISKVISHIIESSKKRYGK